MGLGATPSGERVHIGLFGRRNAGKSSLINAITGQQLAVVSEVRGTTTDPVSKAMELLPLGPVLLTDTPGLDDEGELGHLRMEKARRVLAKTDIALLVIDGAEDVSPQDEALLADIKQRGIPYLVVINKSDAGHISPPDGEQENTLIVSALTGAGIPALKERIAALQPEKASRRIVGDLLAPGDAVVLVVPIDSAAPKGRLILPQQQTIRDILEAGAFALVTKETELADALQKLHAPPSMVITDSQVFAAVSPLVPTEVPLTSFSILFARYKGVLRYAVEGAAFVEELRPGDRVLICEGCTHHRQCDDIGTVKIPRWLDARVGGKLDYSFTSGGDFPQDLSGYKLVVHCGGCTLNEREVVHRMGRAVEQGIPFTNYGILIAHIHGILARTLSPFPELVGIL